MSQLRKDRAALAERRRAYNTTKGYRNDWSLFAAWCAAAGRRSLPATSDSVQLYLLDMARRGKLPATMARHCAAIASQHAAAGLRSPMDADVREVLAGLRRKLGTAPRKAKAALTVPELRQLLKATGRDARGLRDRAILLLGYATGLRRSDLVKVQLSDLKFERVGVVIRIAGGKTDQEGKGSFVGAHYGKRRETCPVLALQAWLKERGSSAGAVFLAFDNQGRLQSHAMAAEGVCDVVQEAAERAGLDGSRFGAHSLRAGLVTSAGVNGVGTLAIMSRTGHRDAAIVQRYMRPGSALAVDPLAGLL